MFKLRLFALAFIALTGGICGAAIINEKYLISAAHCLQGRRPITISVYAGSIYLNEDGTYHPIESYFIHPDYNATLEALYNDLALIKLKNSLQFTDNIQPINLPINITVNPRDNATAAGWGSISYPDEETPNHLQYLIRQVINLDECSKALNVTIPQEQLCFGGDIEHGLCHGDSGGPLLYTVNGKNYIIGTVSWGHLPCAGGYPDVYTRISSFLEWIEEQQTRL